MEEFVMGENGVFNCVKETDDIEYNCGRFVALADAIENQVLWKNKPDDNESYKEVRPTNARRLLTRFCQSPYDTLTVLYNKVNVYIMQSKGIKLCDLCDLLDEMVSRIDTKELKKETKFGGGIFIWFLQPKDTNYQRTANKKITEDGGRNKMGDHKIKLILRQLLQ